MTSSKSTLDPWLAGTRVHHRPVVAVIKAPKTTPTRPVVYESRVEDVPTRELQDHLLIEKGYLPKYSGLPLDHFLDSRAVSKEDRQRLKRKERYWSSKK